MFHGRVAFLRKGTTRMCAFLSNPMLIPSWPPYVTRSHFAHPLMRAKLTSPCMHSSRNATHVRKRRLATQRSVHPDGTVHHLKGDVSPDVTNFKRFELPIDSSGMVLLKSLTLSEMEDWVETTLGEKRFRARQLWQWMYKADRLAATFDEMTDLSKSFREVLKRHARLDALGLNSVHKSADGTRKITFRLDSGGVVETVLIPAEGRTTICVSSQWGCALNCQFCLTGRTGFKRSLTQGEIVDQLVQSMRLFGAESGITNVVFMGEGEPAHNLDNVLRAVDTMTHDQGLHMSPRKVTVSTSGLVPEIKRFATESRANLAVSLHATNDELRNWLMPINRKYNLSELMQTLRDVFPRKHGQQRKVMFQYVMLKGVNDSLQDAKELLRLTAGVPCKVNLIQFNTHEGTEFEASDEQTMLAFQEYLSGKGLTVTIRRSRGDDKMMACGQLGKLGSVQAPRLRVPDKYAHAVRRGTAHVQRERGRGSVRVVGTKARGV
eukprot:TRINITY_DN47993_c0_g1_i1.p1 TRINITY_DN47993_c0_g1~~TRINITY_DN47993_c0_g1_i1.p1  ORF type:complete len:492 (-),score=53.21 TRINITY_DN47993_c0_g1_i1:806-2281(-)